MNPAPWMCPFFAPVKAMMTTSSLASRIWKSFPLGITLWTSLPHISPACLYQPSTSLSGFSLIFIGYSFYYRTIKLVFFLSVPLYSHLSAGEYCIFIKCLFSNLSGMYSTLRTRVTEGHQGSVLKKVWMWMPLVAWLAFSYFFVTCCNPAGAWGWGLP